MTTPTRIMASKALSPPSPPPSARQVTDSEHCPPSAIISSTGLSAFVVAIVSAAPPVVAVLGHAKHPTLFVGEVLVRGGHLLPA
jgi:hypothetical protein